MPCEEHPRLNPSSDERSVLSRRPISFWNSFLLSGRTKLRTPEQWLPAKRGMECCAQSIESRRRLNNFRRASHQGPRKRDTQWEPGEILYFHSDLRISAVRAYIHTSQRVLMLCKLAAHLIPTGASCSTSKRALSRVLQNKSYLYSFKRANVITLLVSARLRGKRCLNTQKLSPSTLATAWGTAQIDLGHLMVKLMFKTEKSKLVYILCGEPLSLDNEIARKSTGDVDRQQGRVASDEFHRWHAVLRACGPGWDASLGDRVFLSLITFCLLQEALPNPIVSFSLRKLAHQRVLCRTQWDFLSVTSSC